MKNQTLAIIMGLLIATLVFEGFVEGATGEGLFSPGFEVFVGFLMMVFMTWGTVRLWKLPDTTTVCKCRCAHDSIEKV